MGRPADRLASDATNGSRTADGAAVSGRFRALDASSVQPACRGWFVSEMLHLMQGPVSLGPPWERCLRLMQVRREERRRMQANGHTRREGHASEVWTVAGGVDPLRFAQEGLSGHGSSVESLREAQTMCAFGARRDPLATVDTSDAGNARRPHHPRGPRSLSRPRPAALTA